MTDLMKRSAAALGAVVALAAGPTLLAGCGTSAPPAAPTVTVTEPSLPPKPQSCIDDPLSAQCEADGRQRHEELQRRREARDDLSRQRMDEMRDRNTYCRAHPKAVGCPAAGVDDRDLSPGKVLKWVGIVVGVVVAIPLGMFLIGSAVSAAVGESDPKAIAKKAWRDAGLDDDDDDDGDDADADWDDDDDLDIVDYPVTAPAPTPAAGPPAPAGPTPAAGPPAPAGGDPSGLWGA